MHVLGSAEALKQSVTSDHLRVAAAAPRANVPAAGVPLRVPAEAGAVAAEAEGSERDAGCWGVNKLERFTQPIVSTHTKLLQHCFHQRDLCMGESCARRSTSIDTNGNHTFYGNNT